MIVLIKTKNSDNLKKAFIRNQVFHEVDNTNKKIQSITTSTILSVYWLNKDSKKMEEWPIKKWLEVAEENNFWGLE